MYIDRFGVTAVLLTTLGARVHKFVLDFVRVAATDNDIWVDFVDFVSPIVVKEDNTK